MQKLNAAIPLLPVQQSSRIRWLPFIPENELHEHGLVMAKFLRRNAGHHCIHLGANVLFDTLNHAVKSKKRAFLLLSWVPIIMINRISKIS